VVFTSGATEGANLLVNGFVGYGNSSAHIICSSVEHPAVLEPVKALQLRGCAVSWIDPNPRGDEFNVGRFISELTPQTAIILLMLANNETGRVYPIAKLCRELRKSGYQGAIVSDTTQALGKYSFIASELFAAGLDALVISSHKIGGPTGIGAVVFKRDNSRCRMLEPQILGGNQEFGFRAGTENVAGISGFGAAAESISSCLIAEIERRSLLRELLWSSIKAVCPEAIRISPLPNEGTEILSNTLLVSFPGRRGDDLVVALDLVKVCCSTGAACASGKQSVSHVLSELALAKDTALGSVRFSLDWDTTEEDVRDLAGRLQEVLQRDGTTKAQLNAHTNA
jgi:cysteine desulfurase